MRLYDYMKLVADGEEIAVWDKEYDIETYFYGTKKKDKWDNAISDLSKLLTIKEIRRSGVVVNLSDVIEKHIDKLEEADLFSICTVDTIMDSIENILSGYVSEKYLEKFVNCLKNDKGDSKDGCEDK